MSNGVWKYLAVICVLAGFVMMPVHVHADLIDGPTRVVTGTGTVLIIIGVVFLTFILIKVLFGKKK
ncbi:MAG: hypothetical protein IIY44_08770 [Erysipelotrichales bacterium]|nr:hypothetical protein [Erysipelotrichales bacterium]MBQ1385516.1 hypothetical protein [Erysipelotrichales bacterium]MBQ2310088.1 hypothetical protein [Erysipelotrichales bacterium]MBQ2477975.1 hypothetical protein [Erysipelotrichales bacterium]MBQ4011314.1 hypothetical protein [Erysipelotrichales bacterium]